MHRYVSRLKHLHSAFSELQYNNTYRTTYLTEFRTFRRCRRYTVDVIVWRILEGFLGKNKQQIITGSVSTINENNFTAVHNISTVGSTILVHTPNREQVTIQKPFSTTQV